MKRFIGISATFLVVMVFVLLIVGCGGGGKSTGVDSGTLAKDKQFEELDQFVDMDFESEGALFDINDIVAGQSSSPYWDGVDSSDVLGDPLMAPSRLQGLGKVGSLQNESLNLVYDDQSGWWSITYSASDEFFGIEINLRDSVRFETLEGNPQQDPDAGTYRVIERGSLTMDWTLSGDEGSFSLVMDTDVDLDVTGLNTNVVTVNGGSAGVFDFDVISPDTSVYLDFDFTASNDEVTVDGPNPGPDACPTGGSASASFSVDIEVNEGGDRQTASGTWDATVQFLGDGRATVTVESGDFSHSATGDICE
ncbi:MAG: hypothetical protein Kow0074_08920 [Candidatus Zixiibacteriota bacterium]